MPANEVVADVYHDWSRHTDHCINCGQPRVGSSPFCEATTAEPGADDRGTLYLKPEWLVA
jgi:hypothetical protein